ncbi:MAG: tetratricopeptide repeat protein [Candidatus Heimdallarchaeota archaeon]|nr:tetratricopeptide repeat protein [Candidatus Heimdallarchaeota archaeon]
MGDNIQITRTLYNIGEIYLQKGNISQARKYLLEALELALKFEDSFLEAKTRKGLAKISILRGDIIEANLQLGTSIYLWRKTNNQIEISKNLIDLALIHKYNRDLKKAKRVLKQALKINEKIGDLLTTSEVLFKLSEIAFELDAKSEIREYLTKLKKMNNQVDNIYLRVRTALTEVLYLNKSPNLEAMVKTKRILDELISQDLDHFELYLSTIINLCNYLLFEYKTTKQESVHDDLINYLDNLYEIAEIQGNHHLIVETICLQSRIALAENNFSIANFFVNEAEEIINLRSLDHLSIKVSILSVEIKLQESILAKKLTPQKIVVTNQLMFNSGELEMLIHDINNYLQSVTGFSQFFETEFSSVPLLKEMASSLDASNSEIQKLISNIIENKNLPTLKKQVELIKISPLKLIRDRRDLFSTQIYHKELDLRISNVQEDLQIIADEAYFGRIIDNLLYNAIKFSPTGGRIEVFIKSDKSMTEIWIENEGAAVPSELQEKIFDKYVKFSGVGFGIGLAFCKQAMKEMNGGIALVSPIPGEEHGTRIILKFKQP